MVREGNLSTDDRGISATMTVVLLIGITLVGVVVIVAAGVVTINDANEDANMEVAEESMLQVDSTFQQSSGSNATVTIPSDVEGQVSVSNDARYNLTLNRDPRCSTESRNLSSIEYESSGQTVAYQGGGVWRMTESGATMTSPPDITYSEGSLSFSFVNVDGDISRGDELRTNTTGQVSRQREMALALYTNQSYSNVTSEDLSTLTFRTVCQPTNIRNATLRIEGSQYARAWNQWARENYNDNLVWTDTSDGVEPGDTIEIHFLVGDVSNPYFEVSNVSYRRTSTSDPVEVNATVTNIGGLETTRPVSVVYNGETVNQTDLTLNQDEQTEVRLTFSAGELEPGDGTINVSANNTVSRFVSVEPSASDPVTETTLRESATISTAVGIAESADGTVDVENTGGMTVHETVTLSVGGETVRTWNRTLNGSETATLDVGAALPTDEEVYGEPITIRGDIADNTIDETYTVAPSGTFSIQSVSAPSDPEDGDNIDISATIENTGSRTATLPVTITIEDPSGTEVVDETSSETLSAGSTTTVTEDHVLSATGEYRYVVETPNETTTGSFHTDEVDEPNFQILSTTTPDRARIGSTAQFGLTVENTGDADGARALEVVHDDSGTVVASQEVSIGAGGTTYPTVDVPIDDPFTVDSEDDDYTIRFVDSDAESNGAIDVHDDSVVQCEDGECTNTVGIRAEITFEGAEFENPRVDCFLFWCSLDYVSVADGDYPGDPSEGSTELPGSEPFPTEVRLLTDGSVWGDGPLWEDEPGNGDLNHPEAEAILIDDSETRYTEEIVLDPGTEVSFRATRYGCDSWDATDYVVHDNIQPNLAGTEWPGVADVPCTDRDGVDFETDITDSSQNVITYRDGDEADGIDEANAVQIPLDQMVDGQIDEDGQYDLATDERIYAFELNREATPDDIEGNSEIDYNDAIIRYNAVEIVEETTAPATFEINSIDRPVQVSPGDSVPFTATVENIGDEEGTTDLTATFEDSGTASVETADGDSEVTLGGGETEEITVTLDSAGVSPTDSNYDWEVNAEANPGTTPEASGSVYVGNGDAASAELSIAAVEGPLATDDDEPATTIVEITNVGNGQFTGSQTITLHVDNETDGTSYSVDQTFDRTLSAGGTDSVSFDLPETQGEYSYDVTVAGSTSRERSFFVGTSSVDLRGESNINIGTYYYDTSSRIERDGGISAMNIRLENTGTIGDDREVELTISDTDGDPVFSGSQTTNFGQGDIRSMGSVRNTSSFDTNLDPGYYEYEITVLEDGTVDATATGDMYLRNTSDGVDASDPEQSPVDVDTSTVSVSD